MARNPNWTRDEVMLALDLYADVGPEGMGLAERDRKLVALSEALNALPIHPLDKRNEKSRDPAGVGKILGNLAAIDPDCPGKGLQAHSYVDDEVWAEFWHDKKPLHETGERIRDYCAQYPINGVTGSRRQLTRISACSPPLTSDLAPGGRRSLWFGYRSAP